MTNRSTRVALAAAALAVASCTEAYLVDPRNQNEVSADRSVALEGQLCMPSPGEVVRPIKILLAMDASQSMNNNDPNGKRAQAMIDLMANLPNDPEVYISILLFAGSTSAWLIDPGLPEPDRKCRLRRA